MSIQKEIFKELTHIKAKKREAVASPEERFIGSRQSMIEEEPGYFLSQK